VKEAREGEYGRRKREGTGKEKTRAVREKKMMKCVGNGRGQIGRNGEGRECLGRGGKRRK